MYAKVSVLSMDQGEIKVEFHDLNCINEFSARQKDANVLGDSKINCNDLSDLKSEACEPNGNGSNYGNVLFTFISEEGVTIKI